MILEKDSVYSTEGLRFADSGWSQRKIAEQLLFIDAIFHRFSCYLIEYKLY